MFQTVKNVNDFKENLVKITETNDKTLISITKITGVLTDRAKDTICTMAHCIGICNNAWSMVVLFIPDINIIIVVTLTVLIFIACKLFLSYYKKAKKMPWDC